MTAGDEPRRPRRTSVLVVDDHSAIREGLKAALDGCGEFQVVAEAGDGEQALALVQSIRPDIVILDIALPRRSGIEAAQQMRRLSPSTKIVAYSMHADADLVARMARAGVNAYVLKGEPLANLLGALRLARAGKSRFPQPALPSAGCLTDDNENELGERLRSLSKRELEVFLILACGRSVKQAAFDLGVSPKTVETYKARLMRKLCAGSTVELAKIAFRAHLLQP